MGLIDRLFGKKTKENEQPLMANNRRNNEMNFKKLQRRDGTSIDIMPVLDETGYQKYESVYNNRTHEGQYIAKFIISSQEVERLGKGNFITILMDVDENTLNTLEGVDWIANGLLSGQRIEKIINTYNGYAGGLTKNQNGQITGKYIDQGIVEWLKMDAQEKNEVRKKEQAIIDEKLKAEAIAKAEKQGINIKTSHAENLSL